jgi:hypothetical protein
MIILACVAVAVLIALIWGVCRAAWRDPYDLDAIVRQGLEDDLAEREAER